MRARLALGLLLLCGVLAAPLDAAAQRTVRLPRDTVINRELAALRAAMELERAGEFARADSALRAILDGNPESLSALISLERMLAMQGRTAELLPYVDRLIESDPESPIGHQMRVRAYSMLQQPENIESAAQAWIRASPDVETPYREIARIWRQRGDYERALKVLEQGRERVDREDALALELGDLYADMDQPERAIREWERAISDDGQGFLLVQRRLGHMPDGGAAVVHQLIRSLMEEPTSLARRRAATQVAIDAGLADEAARIVREVAETLEEDMRRPYLIDVARRADGAGLAPVAYWAYSELLREQLPEEQSLALRTRLAELALVVGDTARAAREYGTLEAALAPESPQRRQALAIRLTLAARSGEFDEALEALGAFRAEFPEAPELDGIVGTLGGLLLEGGRIEDAERLVAAAYGPQATLVRGRTLLMRGEVERARTELLNAAPALNGGLATETIMMVTLLGRVSAAGGELVGRALARIAEGERAEAVEMVLQESSSLADAERAALLSFAASLAERERLPELAQQARRTIVHELPGSQEAPAALLALARTLAQSSEELDAARVLVERLILEYPRSALVPQARQELDRISGRVP